ncbi:hypothetical protein EDB86DRAFT_1566754 [Lactarius hatsudake]|nr:hypothetical protein EDB86DRAFT_1566754 [Lactarius hatsudake]
MDDQDQDIRLKDVIQRRPTSDLELVFKDDAGVTHQSNKFKDSIAIRWNLDSHVRTHTSATLAVKRALFKIRGAVVPVQLTSCKAPCEESGNSTFHFAEPGSVLAEGGMRRSSIRREEGLFDRQDVDGIRIGGSRSTRMHTVTRDAQLLLHITIFEMLIHIPLGRPCF